ncbi:hypothetical protein L1277_000953 [Okibacterium sp. HSC-33S16]|uniref:ribosomal maturation YjgA family protein n=1 Tax=Okibacterium sp. HSC-33S16 TaxID=2910965 RepID=UPI00209F11E6|nr:DUF2809 domain-containing protein [Okibacterium sp. HSC-33S16]MCP2030889.1 hypothetical protein [Okibacterium sp. HSC-33S16]
MSDSTTRETSSDAQSFRAAPPRYRRAIVLGAAVLTVISGLAVATLGSGFVADAVGDGLYTVLVYLLIAAIAPRLGPGKLAALAFTASALIEFSQLTGIPAALAQVIPASRWVFGSTFVGTDLAFYAIGAAAVAAVDTGVMRQLRRR